MLEKAGVAASRGLDHDDIARVLGISVTTLYEHKAKNEEFAEAIRRGKAKGHLAIADAVYNKAKAGNMDAARLILSRRYGWQEHQKIEVEGMQQGAIGGEVMIDARTLNLHAGNGNGSKGGTDAADEQHSDDDLRAEILSSLDRIAAASRAPSVVIDQKSRST
jgi:hypothetical protein